MLTFLLLKSGNLKLMLILIDIIIFQAPGQACWVLWKNILGPYFMQRTPEDEVPEINEKKQKKLERRKKRQQNVRF